MGQEGRGPGSFGVKKGLGVCVEFVALDYKPENNRKENQALPLFSGLTVQGDVRYSVH